MIYDLRVSALDGSPLDLGEFRGKALLVVNVASQCGLTSQYTALEEIHERYRDRGFSVLGVPCNQFGAQEPGSDADVKEFCSLSYGVTFPMFSKVEVNGPGRHPLYAWLTAEKTAPEGPGDIKWNFTKFLVGRDGRVAARFDPRTEPAAPELVAALEKALG